MEAKSSASRAIIVTPDQALPIKPFGLDMKVLLTAEATGGAQLGHRSTGYAQYFCGWEVSTRACRRLVCHQPALPLSASHY